jgi:quinol monooxygenase YgiN
MNLLQAIRTVHSVQGDALTKVLLEAAESMHTVEGCESYKVSISNTDPVTIWVNEVWTDETLHATSLTLESTKMLIQ